MQTPQFQKTLQMLNPAQTEAVHTIDGPVMVMAGPGTGKTHVLAARIAHILQKTDTPPHAILALTFTESAAVNMRERVVEMIGKEGYYVQIMTFHAFCSDVIKTHPEYFPIDRNSEALNDLEKYDVFQTLLQTLQLEALKPLNMPLFYIKDIIQSISQLKREGIEVEDFAHIIKIAYKDIATDSQLTKAAKAKLLKAQAKNEELLKLYEAYQTELRKRLRYDFDDMIALVVQALKKEELLLQDYQEKLHYFLVDEYQDTNTSQNMVVEMLASYWGEEANLFVVGDPNQSIYRFQGASIENTLNFVQKFPRAKIITLDLGYRGTQVIYDAAHSLISNNQLTQDVDEKKLSSAGEKGEPLIYAASSSETLELVYIAEEIKKLHAAGSPYEDIAVLYRNNADSVDIQRVLEKWGIPYEIEGGENILESEMIRQLLQVLYVIDDVRRASEDEKLFEIMAYDWTDIDPILAMKIAQAAGKAHTSIVSLISSGYEEFMKHYGRTDVTHIEFHAAELFVQQLQLWAVSDSRYVFTEWFEKFLHESGYVTHILKQENKIELLTNVNSLFREVKALVSQKKSMKLREFIRAVKTMQDNRMSIFAEDFNIKKGVVHLSTVHRAKGREWDYVFIAHCIDGRWGNTRTREMIPFPDGLLKNTDLSKKERNEDERRLFYVALTRARKQVYLSYPESIQSGSHSREVAPCMFIEEISEELLTRIHTEAIEEKTFEHVQALLQPMQSPLIKISDRDFYLDTLQHFKLSITALNTYLRSTEEFITNVMLRVPRSKPPAMAFGSAVHYALEMRNKALMEGKEYALSDVVKDFEEALEREIITDDEYHRRLSYGKDVLQKYLTEYGTEPGNPIFVEHFFGSGLRKTVLDDIPLSGRIDRIDMIDPEKKLVRVIDYKTGSAKTAGEIEGKTVSTPLSERELTLPDSIRGSYKRQLLFYKLLTELDPTFQYTTEEGVFDFVEPNKQTGKLVRRAFTLKDSDVEDLKTLIRQVMKEIRNLEFLERGL